MAGPYSPQVEQWRPLVEKYFPPEHVDKALFVISKESGGRSIPQIGGGPGTGLFQVEHGGAHPGRLSQQQLLDPETNVRVAAQMPGKNWNQWTDWGEGVTYQGKKFGALGNYSYNNPVSNRVSYEPGGNTGSTAMPTDEEIAKYAQAAGISVDEARRFLMADAPAQPPTPSPAAPSAPAQQSPADLPPWARKVGGNLAVGKDPETGTTYQWEYNGSTYVDPVSQRIVPQGWNPRGTPDTPNTPGEGTITYQRNSTTGKLFAVQGGKVIGEVSELAEKPAADPTRRPNAFEMGVQARREIQGGSPLGQSQPTTVGSPNTPQPIGAPPAPSSGTAQANRTQIIYDLNGRPVMERLNYGDGGIHDRPLNTANIAEDLALFGLAPNGRDRYSSGMASPTDIRAAQASRNFIAASQTHQSPREISHMLDYYRNANLSREGMKGSAFADQRISANELAGLNSPVAVPSNFDIPAQELDVAYGFDTGNIPEEMYEDEDEFRTYADGGQALIGGGFTTKGMSRQPNREGDNYSPYQLATRQLADRGYRPMDKPYTGALYDGGRLGMVPPWLLPQWGRGARQGMGYGPGQDNAMGSWAADGYIGGIPRPNEPHESYTGNAVNSYPGAGVEPQPRGATRNVGYAPRFANGGTQMLDEPVMGMGVNSGEPKFLAGEAGPEMATFTPVGQRPQEQTNAPYAQAQRPVQLLDPRRVLMSMKRKR
jgi:hypothetical protein